MHWGFRDIINFTVVNALWTRGLDEFVAGFAKQGDAEEFARAFSHRNPKLSIVVQDARTFMPKSEFVKGRKQ